MRPTAAALHVRNSAQQALAVTMGQVGCALWWLFAHVGANSGSCILAEFGEEPVASAGKAGLAPRGPPSPTRLLVCSITLVEVQEELFVII